MTTVEDIEKYLTEMDSIHKSFLKDFNNAVSVMKSDMKDSPGDVYRRLEYIKNLCNSHMKKIKKAK